MKCFHCDGELIEFKSNWAYLDVFIPDLTFLKCNKCGDECVPPEAGRIIDAECQKAGMMRKSLFKK